MFKIKIQISDLEKDIDINLESPEMHSGNVLHWLENAVTAAVFSVDAKIPQKLVYINSRATPYQEKINLIKAIREITGCGLYEAKKLVESDATLFKCRAHQAEQLLAFLNEAAKGYRFSTSSLRMSNSYDLTYRSSFMDSALNEEELEDHVIAPGKVFLQKHGIPL